MLCRAVCIQSHAHVHPLEHSQGHVLSHTFIRTLMGTPRQAVHPPSSPCVPGPMQISAGPNSGSGATSNRTCWLWGCGWCCGPSSPPSYCPSNGSLHSPVCLVLCMCVCVCVCVCLCVTHVCARVCIRVHVCLSVSVSASVYVYVNVFLFLFLSLSLVVSVCMIFHSCQNALPCTRVSTAA